MKQKRKLGRKLLSFLLTLAMVVGLMPGMGLTALAWDGDPYANLLNTTTVVNFDGIEWYLIKNNSTALNAGTVTLLSKECVGASIFGTNGTYSGSTVESYVNNWYTGNISSDAKTAVSGNGAFLLSSGDVTFPTSVRACPRASGAEYDDWWLSSSNSSGSANCIGSNYSWNVDSLSVSRKLGVRPALELDLSSVIFESGSNTFTVASDDESPSGGGDSSSDTSSKTSSAVSHTHSYAWEDGKEATEDDNGEMIYKCSCGEVLYRVPTSAYNVFNRNTAEKIKNAKQGATVKIETSRWISFHKMVMQALADRPDVSLEVSFLDGEYKGNRVSFTIPAGTDTLSLLDENGFSGFLYLAGKFGTAN